MAQKGFYLYAVKPASYRATFPEIKGIDDSGAVFPLPIEKEIEAIVSLVPLDIFSAKEIADKAQNDLTWIKEKSILHNNVVMKSAEESDGAVVPMKFGLVFKNKKTLQEALKKEHPKFTELFRKLKGNEEWSVKMFAEPELLKHEIIETNPDLAAKRDALASLPTGFAYFKAKELDHEIEQRKRGEFQNWGRKVFVRLCKLAHEGKQGKILGKELTQKTEPMILNAIFLIHREKVQKFLQEVEKLHKSLSPKGLLIYVSGPWPPYNFV
jgi:hypothetical protein